MKTFHDKQAHREWKRKFKQEMRGWKRGFQREMQESTHQWQQHWAQHPRFPFGAVFVAPFLSLLLLLCLGVWLYALYSLVTAGSVFGVPLPAGIPLWIGIIFLIVVYHFFAWPLKAMRYTCYYQGSGPCPPRSLTGPFDGLVWLGFIVLIIWLADHYVPQVHEALQNLPPVIHRTLDSVQEWWAKR
jgi:hypothetical protein